MALDISTLIIHGSGRGTIAEFPFWDRTWEEVSFDDFYRIPWEAFIVSRSPILDLELRRSGSRTSTGRASCKHKLRRCILNNRRTGFLWSDPIHGRVFEEIPNPRSVAGARQCFAMDEMSNGWCHNLWVPRPIQNCRHDSLPSLRGAANRLRRHCHSEKHPMEK